MNGEECGESKTEQTESSTPPRTTDRSCTRSPNPGPDEAPWNARLTETGDIILTLFFLDVLNKSLVMPSTQPLVCSLLGSRFLWDIWSPQVTMSIFIDRHEKKHKG